MSVVRKMWLSSEWMSQIIKREKPEGIKVTDILCLHVSPLQLVARILIAFLVVAR